MKRYRIWVNKYDMGIYVGADEEDALERYARDAGYRSWSEIEEPDTVEVFEVE